MPDDPPTAAAAAVAGEEPSQATSGADGGAASANDVNQIATSLSQLSTSSAAASATSGNNEDAVSRSTDTSRTARDASEFGNINRAMRKSPFKSLQSTDRIGKKSRVAITKSGVYHSTDDEDQRHKIPRDWPNSGWIYATVIGGSSASGWILSVDIFESPKKTLLVKKRERIIVLPKGYEEPPFNYDEYRAGELDGEIDLTDADPSKTSKKSPAARSTEEFLELDPEIRCVCTCIYKSSSSLHVSLRRCI